jgi:hypothetical protein
VSAKAFTADLQKAIREYTRARDVTPVVKVTLADGASHYVMRATPGASDMLVALDVYPEQARIYSRSIGSMITVPRRRRARHGGCWSSALLGS